MMGLNGYSDYSTNTKQPTAWRSAFAPGAARSFSFDEGISRDPDAVMQEFRMNGSDSPYDPDEEALSHRNGTGPSSMYLRQKSWPAPDSTPSVRLPRAQDWTPDLVLNNGATELSVENPRFPAATSPAAEDDITEQQMRVLRSLPNAVLYPLLRQLEQSRQGAKRKHEEQECRFCKNNGERESYYRSHSLRVGGRVECPILRAFVCRRCGASGDSAHTLKYCPLTSVEERTLSAAMMRQMRTGSGRHRQAPSSDMQEYMVFGERKPSVVADRKAYHSYEALPLDPIWAALEQKLMLKHVDVTTQQKNQLTFLRC